MACRKFVGADAGARFGRRFGAVAPFHLLKVVVALHHGGPGLLVPDDLSIHRLPRVVPSAHFDVAFPLDLDRPTDVLHGGGAGQLEGYASPHQVCHPSVF